MEPIECVIKLEAAYGIAPDVFVSMTQNLYFAPISYIEPVLTIIQEECEIIYDRMLEIFDELDRLQL